jgi:hypothetical protein
MRTRPNCAGILRRVLPMICDTEEENMRKAYVQANERTMGSVVTRSILKAMSLLLFE